MKLTRILAILSFIASLCACGSSEDSGNPPVAEFSYTCMEFVCDFDASASASRGGSLSYIWDFGDERGGVGGRQVRYAFQEGGNFTVKLTVQSTNGLSDQESQTVSVTNNEASAYYAPVHDTARLLILADDLAHAIYSNGDAMQDDAEPHGATSSPGYTRDCQESGTYTVVNWADSNNNMIIDGDEALTGNLDQCRFFATGDILDSRDGFSLSGDFDSPAFSFGTSNNAVDSLRITTYPGWSLRGDVDFSTTAPSGTTILAYQSTTSRINKFNQNGQLQFSVAMQLNMKSSTDRLSDVSGSASFDLTGTVFGLNISDPVTLTKSSENIWHMQQGTARIAAGSDWIYLTPDADPAYIAVNVDLERNGVIDISDRFPQSVVFNKLD